MIMADLIQKKAPDWLESWRDELSAIFPLDGLGTDHVEGIYQNTETFNFSEYRITLKFKPGSEMPVRMGQNLQTVMDERGLFGEMARKGIRKIKAKYDDHATRHSKIKAFIDGKHRYYDLVPELSIRTLRNKTAGVAGGCIDRPVTIHRGHEPKDTFVAERIPQAALGVLELDGIFHCIKDLCDEVDGLHINDYSCYHGGRTDRSNHIEIEGVNLDNYALYGV
jgi:hypothetical protein